MQGEAGTGNVVEAVRHCRAVQGAIRALQTMDDDEVYVFAKELRAPVELVRQVCCCAPLPAVPALVRWGGAMLVCARRAEVLGWPQSAMGWPRKFGRA
jgi:pyridoxal biosynthesis lyase PdxS